MIDNHYFYFTVRGYELDSFGHVNNAVYLNYMEQARWEFLKEKNVLNQLVKDKIFLVVVEANIRYIKEINIFDELYLKTIPHQNSPYIIFSQDIYLAKNNRKIASAEIRTLFVDSNRIPHSIPDLIFKELLN